MRTRGSTGPKPFFAALGAAVIGLVWFVGALMIFNYFFIYPIFLIFAGVVGMVANIGGLRKRQPQLPQQRMPYGAPPPQQPMYYGQQPMPQLAPSPALCWQCGQPNRGSPVCPTCGAQQYAPPTQPPMGAYGAAPAYPTTPNYQQPAGYPPAPGYPPIQPPAAGGWEQPPQQPPQSQRW